MNQAIRTRKIETLYPSTGPLSRQAYSRHVEFFAAGRIHRERAIIAGNRTGKSEAGAYEVALHATGQYPECWPGRRFNRTVKIWVAGDTANTARDILQTKLLGPVGDFGTGLIPKKAIERLTYKRNLADAVQDITGNG